MNIESQRKKIPERNIYVLPFYFLTEEQLDTCLQQQQVCHFLRYNSLNCICIYNQSLGVFPWQQFYLITRFFLEKA
jgi:hypothetical protein